MNQQIDGQLFEVKIEEGGKEKSKTFPRLALLKVLFITFGLIDLILLTIIVIKRERFFKRSTQPIVRHPKPTNSTPTETKPTESKSIITHSPLQAIAQVGKETLYGQDLDYKLKILKIFSPNAFTTSTEQTHQTIENKALELAIEDSIILQAGEEEGIITLTPTVFNNPRKNYPERNKLINQAKKELPSKVVDQIDGESISIWFFNMKPPAMGVEKAKKITYNKITKIYEEIKSGRITFKQAGEKIAADQELEKIAVAYKSNAYSIFREVDRDWQIFHDPELNKVLWSLKEGEISPILTGRDFDANGRPYEAYFTVLKVNRRSYAQFSSFKEWLKAKRETYAIKIF